MCEHCKADEQQERKKTQNDGNILMVIFLPVQNYVRLNVTKTMANLTTFSKKPGNYNGNIIFEIDMKNSSPLNVIFTFFAMSKPK